MKLLLIGIIGWWACIGAHAQDLKDFQCPTLSVIGPPRTLDDGEKARFTVRFEPKSPEWPLKYQWFVSSGKIISGQGTETIEVERAIHYVTATISLNGFPRDDHCPASASEDVRWNVKPIAEKLKSFPGESFAPTIYDKHVVTDLWANHRLYVLLGFKRDTPHTKVAQRELELLEWIGDHLDRNRYVLERVYGSIDITEFWRVPPGAENPQCQECKKQEANMPCSPLHIIGKPKVPQPGEVVTYSVNTELASRANLSFEWAIVSGEIIAGQGTPAIKVRISDDFPIRSVVVTVSVKGLPAGNCPVTASETIAASKTP